MGRRASFVFRTSRIHRQARSQETRFVEYFSDPSLWWNQRCSNRPSDSVDDGSTMVGSLQVDLLAEKQQLRTEKQVTAWKILAALKRCSKMRDFEAGKKLHSDAAAASLLMDKYVAGALITMYSKCRSMAIAREVFDGMIQRDVVAWTSLILGYVENGQSLTALDLFTRMDCQPNSFTYVAALKACGSLAAEQESETHKQIFLEKGIAIHKQARGELELDSNMILANTLVDMYSKCGSVDRARQVFDSMVSKDVVTWTSLILGYVQQRECLAAIDLFASMDCEPDLLAYVAVLKACANLASERSSEKSFCLEQGIAIHQQVRNRGLESNIVLANTLIDMYSKYDRIYQAKEIFDRMVCKDVVSWTSLMLGYVNTGQSSAAMELYARMDCEADCLAYVAALKACGCLASEESESGKQRCLEKGIAIHEQAKVRGFESERFVASSLVEMYSKCGSLHQANMAFDRLDSADIAAWNSLIQAYVRNGENQVAIDLFATMDCEPDAFTYVAALKACGSLAVLQTGQQIHARVCKIGLEQDQLVANALLDLYGKCGSMTRAEEVFNNMPAADLISWTSLIAGYCFSGDPLQVFHLVKTMQEGGLRMDIIAFTCVLAACSHTGRVMEGKFYFDCMLRYGISPTLEHYACMVDMLGRANMLQEALDLVESMPLPADTVTWMSLLGACRKWNNVEVGKVAFDALATAGTSEAGAYDLMSGLYGSSSSSNLIDAKQMAAGCTEKKQQTG